MTAPNDIENTGDSNAVSVESTTLFGAWRPIASAPCDGTEILAFDPHGETYDIVKWEDEDGAFIAPNGCPGFDYTHWMPLPNPPNTKAIHGEKGDTNA